MNSMNIVLFILLQIILKSFGENFISFDSFIKNNKIVDVSDYAESIGFPDFDFMFNSFKIKFNKNYTKEEEVRRKYHYMYTLLKLEKNKQQLQNGEVYHELAINKFADLLPQEKLLMTNNWSNSKNLSFTQQLNGESDHILNIDTTQPLPKNFDWRQEHVLTEVKDQGACGSSWAFAAISTIESAYAIKYNITSKQLIKMSEQQMIDCVFGSPYHSEGCNGGKVDDVYSYVYDNGVVKESDYRYEQTQMTCKSTDGKWKTKISDYYRLLYNASDMAIMHAIYSKGPVAIIINTGDSDFDIYSKGILTSPGNQNIMKSQTNHYITAVGWGTENGIDYWIIKNSYGSDWGENGYFRLKRGINNRGFNSVVYFPTFQQIQITTTKKPEISTTKQSEITNTNQPEIPTIKILGIPTTKQPVIPTFKKLGIPTTKQPKTTITKQTYNL